MKRSLESVRLCVLISEGFSDLSLPELVREVVTGGADCIQLREKNVPDRRLLERARACRQACDDAIFIVNDRPDIAVIAEADGVHVGQGDLPPAAARRIVGDDLILGVSASTREHVVAAQREGADYLGVGALFPTGTKDVSARGLDLIREVAGIVTVPFLAIGGIDHENVASVIRTGAPGVAVCSAIIGSEDPRGAARAMRETILAALQTTDKG
ncbi:MAG: thiamine phosphate synthase [Planctomycetota bacterium]|jgi:thiamine-phosphate pyrophosphorylase